MEITEIKVFPVEEHKLKAFVSIVLDDCFMVNDIKIIRGREGRFISMPSRRKKNGDFKDVAHPLNNETRRMMEDRIFAEYDRVVGARDGEAEPRRETRAEPKQEPKRQDDEEPATAATPSDEESTPGEADDRSLKEVTEEHLSESFWTS